MDQDKQKTDKTDARRTRREYVAPRLREFGPVGILTQAGTGPNFENPMNAMNPMQRP